MEIIFNNFLNFLNPLSILREFANLNKYLNKYRKI